MDGYPYNKKLNNFVELKKIDNVLPYDTDNSVFETTYSKPNPPRTIDYPVYVNTTNDIDNPNRLYVKPNVMKYNKSNDNFIRGNQFSSEFVDPNLLTDKYLIETKTKKNHNIKYYSQDLNSYEAPYDPTAYYGYPREKNTINNIPYWEDENTFVHNMDTPPQLLKDNDPDKIIMKQTNLLKYNKIKTYQNSKCKDEDKNYSIYHLILFLIFIFFIATK
jgi:hypothetical protein